MAPVASDKKQPRQTSSRIYCIYYKHRSIKSIDYRQASPRVTDPNIEMRNPVHRTVFNGLWKDQVGGWYCRNGLASGKVLPEINKILLELVRYYDQKQKYSYHNK